MEHLELLPNFPATKITAEEGYGTTFPIARVCSVINLHHVKKLSRYIFCFANNSMQARVTFCYPTKTVFLYMRVSIVTGIMVQS
jgi:hypothetical protein